MEEAIILTLPNGFTLRSGEELFTLGAYVRFCAPEGEEVLYWHWEEWAEAPESVMGAILSAILHPEKLEHLQQIISQTDIE